MSGKPELHPIILRFLGYRDAEGWVAHCLETDLVGYGKTPAEAEEMLVQMTQMQFGFSVFKRDPSLIVRPAPPHIFELYSMAMDQALKSFPRPYRDPEKSIGSIPLPFQSPDEERYAQVVP